MRVRPESAEDRPVRQLMKIHLLKESLRVHSEARSISTRQLVSTGGEERVWDFFLRLVVVTSASVYKQELSYRQQIAHQLRTRYAEGIYKHKYYTVTLKPRLRVTQGH